MGFPRKQSGTLRAVDKFEQPYSMITKNYPRKSYAPMQLAEVKRKEELTNILVQVASTDLPENGGVCYHF